MWRSAGGMATKPPVPPQAIFSLSNWYVCAPVCMQWQGVSSSSSLPHSYLPVRFAFVLSCRSYAPHVCVVAAADIFIATAAFAFEYPELLISQQARKEGARALATPALASFERVPLVELTLLWALCDADLEFDTQQPIGVRCVNGAFGRTTGSGWGSLERTLVMPMQFPARLLPSGKLTGGWRCGTHICFPFKRAAATTKAPKILQRNGKIRRSNTYGLKANCAAGPKSSHAISAQVTV